MRLRLLLGGSSRGPSRSGRRTSGSATRRGRGGTTALTRHDDYVKLMFDGIWRICRYKYEIEWRKKKLEDQ